MKRLLAGFVGITMAAFLASALGTPAATAATTAAPKPPDAIKRQFVPGRGVKFTQVTRRHDHTIARGGGVFQFDRSGVIASDITTTFPDDRKKDPFETPNAYFSPVRTIWVRGTAYSSGDLYDGIFDPGQKWVRVPKGSPLGFGNFVVYVNILDPASLRTLLSQSASKRSPYRITTTYGRLYRLSPWFRTWGRPKGSLAKMKVNVTVHVGANGLPRRVVTTFKLSKNFPVTTETRFTAWGTRANIKAPHGAEVADGSRYSPR